MKASSSITAVVVGSAILTLTVACSSSDSSSGGNSASTKAFVTASCNYSQKCDPEGIAIAFGTVDNCVAVDTETSPANLPGQTFTDAQVQACADAINAASCDADIDAIAACQIKGSLANGTACNDSTQCSSGYCQDSSGVAGAVSACGKCAPIAADGAACTDDEGCNANSECDPTKLVCTPQPAKGAACTAGGVDCQTGSTCIANVCTDPLPAGAACDENENSCAQGLGCVESKCTAESAFIVPTEVGQACGVNTTTLQDSACKFSSCVGAAGAAKCVAFAAAGQACATDDGSGNPLAAPDCGPNFLCTSGKCVASPPVICK